MLPKERSPGWECLGLFAVVAVAFAFLVQAPFVYDDLRYVLGNPLVTGPWPGWKTLLLRPDPSLAYEPLIALEHRILYSWAGAQPWIYRGSSLVLHAANACLLLALLRRWPGDKSLAFWGALLFALYPAHVEVLALSTFKTHLEVALAALLVLNILEDEKALSAAVLAACWALFAFALLCKETALLIPLLAAAAGGKSKKPVPDARLWAGWGVIASAYVALRLGPAPRPLEPLMGGSLGRHALTSGKIGLWLASQFPLPWNPGLEHSLAPVGPWPSLEALLIPAGLGACAMMAAALLRKDHLLGKAAALMSLSLLPFLNIIPLFNFSLVADRYLYLASAGFFLLLVRFCSLIKADRRTYAPIALGALAFLYAAMDWRRSSLFLDPLELWKQTALAAPRNPRARAALGAECLKRGLYPEAEAELKEALALAPAYLEPYMDLGVLYSQTGRIQEALRIAQARLALRPDAAAWHNLGVFQMKAGKTKEGLLSLEKGRE
ncbi:MAG: tetratricopeptide repeat protein [Elusimicrobia bacterium]|nr:tetratricopeptide repeat protein [Elusimicrobiota bacterium]